VRIPVLFASLFCLALPLPAQVPDPGASQDEEAAREKILKAADQLDLMEGNAEATKTAVDSMKTDLAKLEADNAALKMQVSTLQDAFQKSEAERAKERQVLLDEVSKLVAAKGASHPVSKKKTSEEETSLSPTTEAETAGPATKDQASPAESAGSSDASASADAPAPKPRKGYSYTVEAGQTLTMICAAYRAQGVNVTVAQVRKANGLTEKSVLKVGQKLFIPKPGN
jgi:LysM repeat protein